MIRGEPGVGKTLLGLQFLSAGVEAGDSVLFVNMGNRKRTCARTLATSGSPWTTSRSSI